MTYRSLVRRRPETQGWDFENVSFWRFLSKSWFSGAPGKHFRAFRRAAAQNQVTRRAEIGSFSASARRVMSDQSKLSFPWACPKFENLTIQIDFWRSFLLQSIVSHMFMIPDIFIIFLRMSRIFSGMFANIYILFSRYVHKVICSHMITIVSQPFHTCSEYIFRHSHNIFIIFSYTCTRVRTLSQSFHHMFGTFSSVPEVLRRCL